MSNSMSISLSMDSSSSPSPSPSPLLSSGPGNSIRISLSSNANKMETQNRAEEDRKMKISKLTARRRRRDRKEEEEDDNDDDNDNDYDSSYDSDSPSPFDSDSPSPSSPRHHSIAIGIIDSDSENEFSDWKKRKNKIFLNEKQKDKMGNPKENQNPKGQKTKKPKLKRSSESSPSASPTSTDLDTSNDSDEIPFYSSSLLPPHRDFSSLPLSSSPSSLSSSPLFVCPSGRIFLEKSSPFYKESSDFLIAISDPICRPLHVHEYQITAYSLYAAASLGLQTNDIIRALQRLSKVEISSDLIDFIQKKTEKCGKLKLLLRKSRYFVESKQHQILTQLLRNPIIAEARIDNRREEIRREEERKQKQEEEKAREHSSSSSSSSLFFLDRQLNSLRNHSSHRKLESISDDKLEFRDEATGYILNSEEMVRKQLKDKILLPGTKSKTNNKGQGQGEGEGEDQLLHDSNSPPSSISLDSLLQDDISPSCVYSIEISPHCVENVRRVSNELSYPMLEEYDFRKDSSSPDLPINLRPSALIRDYQEKSLSKMFGAGRARSGIIVLPCGAGKTLVGITAASTIKKSTLVFCTTGVAVDQWKRQFLLWSNLPPKFICVFTSTIKDRPTTDALVLITTYNMVSFSGKRSSEAEEVMSLITKHEWGLILADEVHVAPAKMFRKVMSSTQSRCKLGLTATLVREDNLVDDLFYLIGPKLYEANWMDLQMAGHLANVQCVQVELPMTSEFYSAYLSSSLHKKLLLYCMNPNKFRATEYLIRLHEARGDKVLVFSDNVFALKTYAWAMGKPFIFGETTDSERLQWLYAFQHDTKVNTLFISKVGDNSIDLPDVNVIIQISSHFASRRQEAQRLGRILRPKSATVGRFNAFFYSLVSKDTKEMLYATKRQRFLVEQGYAFKVVTEASLPLDSYGDLHFTKKSEQHELLAKVMAADDLEGMEERVEEEENAFQQGTLRGKEKGNGVRVDRRRVSSLRLSGADDRVYLEFQKREEERKEKSRNTIFKSRNKEIKERERERERERQGK